MNLLFQLADKVGAMPAAIIALAALSVILVVIALIIYKIDQIQERRAITRDKEALAQSLKQSN